MKKSSILWYIFFDNDEKYRALGMVKDQKKFCPARNYYSRMKMQLLLYL